MSDLYKSQRRAVACVMVSLAAFRSCIAIEGAISGRAWAARQAEGSATSVTEASVRHGDRRPVLPVVTAAVVRGAEHGRHGAARTPAPPAAALFAAIRQVESGGDDHALGDGGRSVGAYQCGLLAWLDGGGRREDYPRLAYDRLATERVMVRYWRRYGAATDEQRARCWNSGPAWRQKYRLTDRYWAKVKELMERQG